MTIEQALALREGDHVVSKLTRIPYRPARVTRVWHNAAGTIVRIRLASVAGDAWIDATGYELPPPGYVYDSRYEEWITRAEQLRRKRGEAAVRPEHRYPLQAAADIEEPAL